MGESSTRATAGLPKVLILGSVALLAIALGAVSRPAHAPAHAMRSAVRVEPRTDGELAMTLALSDDVWSEQVADHDPVTVVLTRAGLDQLRNSGVPHQIVIADIDAVARVERSRLAHRINAERSRVSSDWFAEYRDGDEVNGYMEKLAAEHPTLAQLRTLGSSVEGRPIHALEISNGGTLGIVLDGGHHAREWISVMVPICIADRLVSGYERDRRIRRILDSVRFFVAPVVNPDGYRYSWDVDRYWRKNRRGGYGVDLSRNYSVGWGQAGSSRDTQSPNYHGERAFSEPETQAMRALFDEETIAAHVDFHSFSQVIVYPWSYQRVDPPDRDKFAAIADRMSTAMSMGERYAVRPGSELKTGAGGTAGDWSYGEHGALSFLVELRPTSRDDGGFVLPPEQIVPTCEESLAGVLALADWVIDHHE